MFPPIFFQRLRACLQVVAVILLSGVLARGDDFALLRQRWANQITGGSSYDPADPIVAAAISRVTNSANSSWSSLNKAVTRTYLWSDAASTTDSSDITTSFNR